MLENGFSPSRLDRRHTEATRNRGPDLFGVQFFALDFTALEHVRRECLQHRLLAEVESEGFHVADQPALPVADGGKRLDYMRIICLAITANYICL